MILNKVLRLSTNSRDSNSGGGLKRLKSIKSQVFKIVPSFTQIATEESEDISGRSNQVNIFE